MAKLIQKLKSIFSKEKPILKANPTKEQGAKRRLKKKVAEADIRASFKLIKAGIEENGYYSTTIGALFKRFGVQKRHAANIEKMNNYLEQEGLFVTPGITMQNGWGDAIQIHSFPVRGSKDIFESEFVMESLCEEHKWYEKLDLIIEEGDRQFKPKGSRDRLDFKARDKAGKLVVLELKHKDGDKRLVEQAFRYRSLLKTNFPEEKVSCVIITGNRCIHTARAIHGLSAKKQRKIKWYTYDWDSNNPAEIEFKEVELDFINRHFAPSKKKVTEAQQVQ